MKASLTVYFEDPFWVGVFERITNKTIKLLPVLSIPAWLYAWIGIIALIKNVNIISGFAVHKKLAAVHSVMNKATGALLFLLPLTIPAVGLKYSAVVVCAVATFAAI